MLRRTRNLLLAIVSFACHVASCPMLAEESAELDHWIPAFSFSFDLLGQKARGEVTSGNVIGPPLPAGCQTPSSPGGTGQLCSGSDPKLRPDDAGSDTMLAPLVGGSLELTSPRLVEGFAEPRVFAHADVAASFGEERRLAGEFHPDHFAFPPLDPGTNATDNVIRGQGSRTLAQLERWVYSGGLGVAFTFLVRERTLRVKPSFEYLREQLEITGKLHRAVRLRVPSSSLADFRLIALVARSTQTYHGIGPGLELEVDTGRLGPFGLSVFAAGRGYHFLGDTRQTLHASNASGESASFRFAKERWAWRGSVGLRFRLLHE